MRGYFGIGVERISNSMNVGSLFRSAHAFGAGFMFTIAANYPRKDGGRSDTSDAEAQLPFFSFPDVDSLILPRGCDLVGVEIVDDAIDLPSYHHPRCAAYVFGPERESCPRTYWQGVPAWCVSRPGFRSMWESPGPSSCMTVC